MTLMLRTSVALAILGGCRSAQAGAVPPPEPAPAAQSFFCERSHTNHARSYQHGGIYVDREGAVFSFQHGRGDQALLQVPADSVTEQALLARYAPGRTRVGTVEPAEMAERYAQVLQARTGTLTERRRRGADMGAAVTRCFLPDKSGIYREVVLRQTGDWQFENTSPAAAELAGWLDSLALRAR